MLKSQSIVFLLVVSLLLTACGRSGPPGRGMGGQGGMSGDMRGQMAERLKEDASRIAKQLDFNQDGFVTCNDDYLRTAYYFKSVDKSGNDLLERAEYRQLNFLTKDYLFYDFKTVDKNGDATVSLQELAVIPYGEIRRYDSNSDCTVTEMEIMQSLMESMRQMQQQGGGRGEGRGGRGGRGGGGGGGGGPGGPGS